MARPVCLWAPGRPGLSPSLPTPPVPAPFPDTCISSAIQTPALVTQSLFLVNSSAPARNSLRLGFGKEAVAHPRRSRTRPLPLPVLVQVDPGPGVRGSARTTRQLSPCFFRQDRTGASARAGFRGDGRPDVAQSDWFSLLAWSHSAMLPLFPSVAIGWRGLFLHSGASRPALSFL